MTADYFARRSEPELNSGCWLWTGAVNHNGYGVMLAPRRLTSRAHRQSYIAAHGPIPLGADVCHRCDTPSCVNPDHLWLGTAKANAQDKTAKGRNHIVALLPEQVLEIRRSAATTNALAKLYGVGWNTIQNARDGKTYRHLK